MMHYGVKDMFQGRGLVAFRFVFSVIVLLSSTYNIGVRVAVSAAAVNDKKLMVILLDGFRWDYIRKQDASQLPGFNTLLQRGVTPASGLVPVFPSLSYVNYYSLMTGLYAESHGMVDNYMYDVIHNTEFLIGENPEQYDDYWWNDAEPVWIGAVRQGKRAYMWYWPGCEVEIRKRRPTYCLPYGASPDPSFDNFTEALDLAVEVLRNDSADLAGVYLERVDATGHKYGPDSPEILSVVRQIDGYILRLIQKIESLNVNLMIFSDHGMAQRVGGAGDDKQGLINIGLYLNSSSDWDHVAGSQSGPVQMIWPKDGKVDTMFNALKTLHPNLTVYKKQDIPERYHFKNHYRVAPLYLVAPPGFAIQRNGTLEALRNIGYHGYENTISDMAGILLAFGPDFKRNATLRGSKLNNVNLYQVMCHLLKLKAEPHNGTWSDVCDGLSDQNACSNGPYSGGSSMHCRIHLDYYLSVLLIALMVEVFLCS